MKSYFHDWNLWDWSWTLIASVTAIWLGLHWGEGGWQTALSITTCITGLWCVILVAKGRILNYPIGIINVLGYGYISYQYQLYGETMLNILYFLPMQFIGWFIWRNSKTENTIDTVRVKFLTWFGRFQWAVLSLMAVMAYAWWLRSIHDPLPYLDSTSTVLSIIAMILMAWRYMEQWILWIIVDVVSIAMWYLTIDANGARDIAMLVMWSAYLINAIYGFIAWIKMYKQQPEPEYYGTRILVHR